MNAASKSPNFSCTLRLLRSAVLMGATLGMLGMAQGIEQDKVPEAKRSASGLHLTAVEAADMKKAQPEKVLFLDIRTRAEAMYLGMPTLADYLIPVLDFPEVWEWSAERGEYIQQGNPNFVKDVEDRLARAGLTKDDTVILICRSGVRSNSASAVLTHYGFKRAYTVIDGYEGDTAKDGPQKGQRVVNGWKNAQLPWSYKLETRKMYTAPM